ncbi:hypothetical protein ACE6H2_026800 [Prunus campanulata]
MYSSLSRLSSTLVHRLARCQSQLIASRFFSVSGTPPGEFFFLAFQFGQYFCRPIDNFQQGFNSFENVARNSRSMNFVRGILEEDGKDNFGFSQFPRYNMEQNADIVHLKLMKNNTFVTVTDSKGNKKLGASAGSLPGMKGGPKLSKYAAEATAEHVGRMARNFGLKSVVVKVKGFTYFKKKRQAIVSWKEGFTNSKVGLNPVVYIEDTTRKPHNGCRLPKKRRV